MNSGSAPDHVDWKARCVGLLDEIEKRKLERREIEAWFARILSRVAASVVGLDESLDPMLLRIRELLRGGGDPQNLKTELDSLSEKLAQVTKGANGVTQRQNVPRKAREDEPSQLFSFLRMLMKSSQEVTSLAAFQARVERGEYVSEVKLFGDLERYLQELVSHRVGDGEERKAGKLGLLGRLLGNGKKAETQKLDLSAVQKQLLALMEVIEFPLAGQAQANHLIHRLRGNLAAEEFETLFQDVIALLSLMKANAESQQKSLDDFLSELTDKLSDLERKTVGVRELTVESEIDSEARHARFTDQFEDLRSSASGATELDSLKSLLSNRLAAISDYLATERDAEVKRLHETEQQIDSLTGRLRELEVETGDLRTRLRVEHNLSMRDALTGLPNRMAYDERIDQELTRWQRFRTPFCLLVWDIDHFKSINDRFGHKAGDKALVTIAEVLASTIRDTDFLARFGGEEFVMLLSGTDRNSALTLAEKIRSRVAECGFNSSGKPVTITISCGIDEYQDGDDADRLFERADKALYRAKNDGRNRCALA